MFSLQLNEQTAKMETSAVCRRAVCFAWRCYADNADDDVDADADNDDGCDNIAPA